MSLPTTACMICDDLERDKNVHYTVQNDGNGEAFLVQFAPGICPVEGCNEPAGSGVGDLSACTKHIDRIEYVVHHDWVVLAVRV